MRRGGGRWDGAGAGGLEPRGEEDAGQEGCTESKRGKEGEGEGGARGHEWERAVGSLEFVDALVEGLLAWRGGGMGSMHGAGGSAIKAEKHMYIAVIAGFGDAALGGEGRQCGGEEEESEGTSTRARADGDRWAVTHPQLLPPPLMPTAQEMGSSSEGGNGGGNGDGTPKQSETGDPSSRPGVSAVTAASRGPFVPRQSCFVKNDKDVEDVR